MHKENSWSKLLSTKNANLKTNSKYLIPRDSNRDQHMHLTS